MTTRKESLNRMLEELIEMADITEHQSDNILQEMSGKTEEYKKSLQGLKDFTRMKAMEHNAELLSNSARWFKDVVNKIQKNDGSCFEKVCYLV